MTEKEAIQALRLEGGIEISGNMRRITEFFEGLDTAIKALEEIQDIIKGLSQIDNGKRKGEAG